MTAEAGVFDMFSLPLLRGDPEDGLVESLHDRAHRAAGPTALRGERSPGTGRPRRRGLRLRGHGHRRATAVQLTAPVLGADLAFPPTDPMLDAWLERLRLHDLRGSDSRGRRNRLSRAHSRHRREGQGVDARPAPTTAERWGPWSASPAGAKSIGVQEPRGASLDEAVGVFLETSSTRTDSYVLQPLKSIYFDTEAPSTIGPSGHPIYLALSSLLAVVILTIAGVNYVNLATARAGRRIHEIGVRKALGAHRGQLIRQLLSESVLMSTAATVLGAALAAVLLRAHTRHRGIGSRPSLLRTGRSPRMRGPPCWQRAVGVAAGAYPAWVVAHMQPTPNLGGGRTGGARLRRGLVVTQFTATTALLTMTLLTWQQLDYVQDTLLREIHLGVEAGTGGGGQESADSPWIRPAPSRRSCFRTAASPR